MGAQRTRANQGFFVTASAACQWASDIHKFANSVAASFSRDGWWCGAAAAMTVLMARDGGRRDPAASDRQESLERLTRVDAVEQPDAQRLGGVDALARRRQQQRLRAADQRGQPLGAAPGRHDGQPSTG